MSHKLLGSIPGILIIRLLLYAFLEVLLGVGSRQGPGTHAVCGPRFWICPHAHHEAYTIKAHPVHIRLWDSSLCGWIRRAYKTHQLINEYLRHATSPCMVSKFRQGKPLPNIRENSAFSGTPLSANKSMPTQWHVRALAEELQMCKTEAGRTHVHLDATNQTEEHQHAFRRRVTSYKRKGPDNQPYTYLVKTLTLPYLDP